MNYDVLDFEIGKQLSLSDSVTLRISGGLRYAALDERFDVRFENVFFSNEFKFESDFWGIGPRVTISPTWKPFDNDFRILSLVNLE